jgi:uncharacterized Ntn-hydrolase superfamily protein
VTFSIVASDMDGPLGPEWGVAVASKFLAVGSIVPWARAGAGAVATQALANVSYGPRGIELMGEGRDAKSVLRALVDDDEERAQRQVGFVDARGTPATFTGEECLDWAGGRTGDGFCCQGNVLTGAGVVDGMFDAFVRTQGELVHRLLEALSSGDEAGGDARGKQSAAILVVRAEGGYMGLTDSVVDLRTDDHPEAVTELRRLFSVHQLYFPRPDSLRFVGVDESVASELRALLARVGYDPGDGSGYDDALRQALFDYVGVSNFEERWSDEAQVEIVVLEHLREAARNA